MSCCDGNLTECPGEETEYQDSAHSQIVLLSLVISLWVFSIVQFLREYCEWLLPEPFCESFSQMMAFHEVKPDIYRLSLE